METTVKEKILSQFVNRFSPESETIKPLNIDIKNTTVTRMNQVYTMITNDGAYFIKYGGFPREGAYNAIEVYSTNSLTNNSAVYVFSNLKIENHTFTITDLKQAEDGRFYGVASFFDGTNFTYYLVIFNNFIQDGVAIIRKYYKSSDLGFSGAFQNVAKVEGTGTYFFISADKLVKFEINILEGNKISSSNIIVNPSISQVLYDPQLNILGNKLIYTRLIQDDNYGYEYMKAILNIEEEMPTNINLNSVNHISLNANQFIDGARNNKFEAEIPYLTSNGKLVIRKIDLNGNQNTRINFERTFSSNENLYANITEDYVSVTNNSNIYLFYYDEKDKLAGLEEFYNGEFTGYMSNIQILKQFNVKTIIGVVDNGTNQSICAVKNIYSPNTTSLPYYGLKFALPYYMNLYSKTNDDTSLIFSRDATTRFYSGNQITATFIVPNYLLNYGNIKKANVYGKTNYLLNSNIQDYEKNQFESLYLNFIYKLNLINNTNGLNIYNQIGSNRLGDLMWNLFDNSQAFLSKARITYDDLSSEIIELDIPQVNSTSITFEYEVSGNVTQIEYLSNDENTVYATFKTNLTGTHTITQTVTIQ